MKSLTRPVLDIPLALQSIAAARGLLDAQRDAIKKRATAVASQLGLVAQQMLDSAAAALRGDKKAGLEAATAARVLLDEKLKGGAR